MANISRLGRFQKGGHYSPATEFKKGQTPWNKGVEYTELAGDKHPNWKGGITSKERLGRVKFRQKMQPLVFLRDDYTCQNCEQRGGSLRVHHIKPWSKHPELRFDIDNCQTLCMGCHYYITFKRKLPLGSVWGHNLGRRVAS